MAALLLFGLLTCWIWVLTKGAAGNYLAYDCYGNVLSLSCKAGHRIKVIDDFFGFSSRESGAEDQCRYKKGDCTLTNGRFTSVIHRYCEGKQTCTNFQVDRRFCGTNQTNYEQVEYQCVPDADVTSFCDPVAYTVSEGYLSTPHFPGEYPPDRHCRCSLTSSSRIRLEATHFIVKFDSPCKDWLEIAVGKHKRKLCGAYRSTLRSQAFNLTFHSDEVDGHQGIWLHFSLSPEEKNATIDVKCSSLPWPEITTTTTQEPTTTPEGISTTSETMTSSTEMMTPSTMMLTTTEMTSTPLPNDGAFTLDMAPIVVTSQRPTSELPDIGDENEVEGTRRAPGGDLLKASRFLPDSTPSPPYRSSSTRVAVTPRPSSSLWSPIETVHASTASAPELKPDVVTVTGPFTTTTATALPADFHFSTEFSTMESLSSTSTPLMETTVTATTTEGSNDKNVAYDGKTPNNRVSDLRKVAESKNAIRRKNNRITGIIIISICVGGIILLIVILSVLLCINKRRQPKRQAEKERKKRLQQRLNSLSFYDSIPLYDSIGRKTGATVAERTNENSEVASGHQTTGKNLGKANGPAVLPPVEENGQILDPKRLEWTGAKEQDGDEATGANWSPSSGAESDHESTIYSEIGKSAPPAPPPPAPPPPPPPPPPGQGPKTPPVPTRTLPNGEGPPGYSLHLASMDKNEDIYTHV